MIFSENRYPLFGIMLYRRRLIQIKAASGRRHSSKSVKSREYRATIGAIG